MFRLLLHTLHSQRKYPLLQGLREKALFTTSVTFLTPRNLFRRSPQAWDPRLQPFAVQVLPAWEFLRASSTRFPHFYHSADSVAVSRPLLILVIRRRGYANSVTGIFHHSPKLLLVCCLVCPASSH